MTQDQAPLPGPGPSLDRLVAAKLGYEWETFESGSGPSGKWVKPDTQENAYNALWRFETGRAQPQYSTSWEAAGELVDWIREHISEYICIDGQRNKFIVRIKNVKQELLAVDAATTAPHAICLAFLALPDFEVKG